MSTKNTFYYMFKELFTNVSNVHNIKFECIENEEKKSTTYFFQKYTQALMNNLCECVNTINMVKEGEYFAEIDSNIDLNYIAVEVIPYSEK